MSAVEPVVRTRNRRGEGGQLRDDIISAAGVLLEQTGRDDAVTLRAIARAIGITAPSIYHHFDDRDQILHALVTRTFDRLAAALHPGEDPAVDPVAQLREVSRNYLQFADEHTHLYRVLFERHHATGSTVRARRTTTGVDTMVGADAFGVLLDAVAACIEDGSSAATSPLDAATRLWIGLHGLCTLRASMPYFPWPPVDPQLTDLVDRLVEITPARRTRRR